MTSFIVLSVVISMAYFINTLYFVLVLLSTILTVSLYSIFLGSFSPLFAIILVIIYVGAMMVFIGYICAISPNILFSTSSPILLIFISFTLPLFFTPSVSSFSFVFSPLTDFLYSSSGLSLFIVVSVALFLVLIVVSSQFFSPQGPFRSIS